MNAPETYLGDGLYASFGGWSIWLRAPRDNGDHLVAMELPIFRAFVWGTTARRVGTKKPGARRHRVR